MALSVNLYVLFDTFIKPFVGQFLDFKLKKPPKKYNIAIISMFQGRFLAFQTIDFVIIICYT